MRQMQNVKYIETKNVCFTIYSTCNYQWTDNTEFGYEQYLL